MRAAALACLLIPSLAYADRRTPSPGAGATEPLQGTVLVWHDARLVLDPARPKETVQLATLEGPRHTQLGVAAPMRVVGTRGPLVEVEPIDGTDCVWSRLQVKNVERVRLFVRRADLAPVVTRHVRVTYEDGTGVALEPGLPVIALASGGYVVRIAHEEILVDLPRGSVGHAYESYPPSGPVIVESGRARRPDGRLFRAQAGATARLGKRSFAIRDKRGAIATNVERRGPTTLFPLVSNCAAATVAFPANRIVKFEDVGQGTGGLGGGMGMGYGSLAYGDFLPAGTPLFTRSGRQVAVTTNEIRLDHRRKSKEQACVRLRAHFAPTLFLLVSPPDSTPTYAPLSVCAKPGTPVVHREAPSFRLGGEPPAGTVK